MCLAEDVVSGRKLMTKNGSRGKASGITIAFLLVFSSLVPFAGGTSSHLSIVSDTPHPELYVHRDYTDYNDTMLLINDRSNASITIGNYFKTVRHIPEGNVCHLNCSENETITGDDFNDTIFFPVRWFYDNMSNRFSINYIVTTKGIPLRVNRSYPDVGYDPGWVWDSSVDSDLCCVCQTDWWDAVYTAGHGTIVFNPYRGKEKHFNSSEYNSYLKLVTRLAAYNVSTVLDLINRSSAENVSNYTYLVYDIDPLGYRSVNEDINDSYDLMFSEGYNCFKDNTSWYVSGLRNVSGYYSWGSNDHNFTNYGKPLFTWTNGSIAETAVSTSARTFTYPPVYGQSLIADLIDEGVCGVKGYVYEPYTSSLSNPEILFDRYTKGYNIAESFYMASYTMAWMDFIVGDPKCAPYSVSNNLIINSLNGTAVDEGTILYINISSMSECDTNFSISCDGEDLGNLSVSFDARDRHEFKILVSGSNGGEFCVTVDSGNDIPEVVETDNSMTLNIEGLPPPPSQIELLIPVVIAAMGVTIIVIVLKNGLLFPMNRMSKEL